jgi:hypothetical protein
MKRLYDEMSKRPNVDVKYVKFDVAKNTMIPLQPYVKEHFWKRKLDGFK